MLAQIFRKLVESPYVDSIDWARWHFFWVDERVVPKDHDDSNYKLAYDSFLSKVFEHFLSFHCWSQCLTWSNARNIFVTRIVIFDSFSVELLSKNEGNNLKWFKFSVYSCSTPGWDVNNWNHRTLDTEFWFERLKWLKQGLYIHFHLKPLHTLIISIQVPIPAGNVYAINESLSAEAAADDYETCLKHLVKTNILRISETTGFPKFDLMLLGMGPDGHVASLFPGHGLCNESNKWVVSITDSPKPPSERITFTFPVINSSAHIALVVCGSGKAEAVEAALKKTGNVPPAGSVSAEDELVWFLDKPASSKL